MTDAPIAYTAEGRPLFDNTPTVVAMLVPRSKSPRQLLVIRRNNEPGKGLLGLPGGYHTRNLDALSETRKVKKGDKIETVPGHGLVQVYEDAADRRFKRVRPTPRGLLVYKSLVQLLGG